MLSFFIKTTILLPLVFFNKNVCADEVKGVVLMGSAIKFDCNSKSTPIWLMQNHAQGRMRGIAMGVVKQARFQDER